MSSHRPPALILGQGAYGGLAVIRCLGRRGIDVVTVPHPRVFAPHWSRYAREVPGPPSSAFADVEAWLGGADVAGRAVIPSGDSFAWFVAQRAESLRPRLRLNPPPADAVHALVDKSRLFAHAREAGLRQPESWFPASAADVSASDVGAPVIIKPRTHAGYRHWRKGLVVRRAGGVVDAYRRFSGEVRYDPMVVEYDPDVVRPFIQRYHPASLAAVYNLTGYIGREPELCAFRATRKVLQVPRRVGNGLCFEAAPVVPELREKITALCRAVRYHGIFEAEFVPVNGGYLLIDFNPRYFNAIGLDDARGLPLPWIAYLEAIGDETALADAVQQAASHRVEDEAADAWSHSLLFPTMLAGQLLSGGMTIRDVARWRRWYASRRVVDAVRAPDDRRPGRMEPLQQLLWTMRDPRNFAGKFLAH